MQSKQAFVKPVHLYQRRVSIAKKQNTKQMNASLGQFCKHVTKSMLYILRLKAGVSEEILNWLSLSLRVEL